MLLQMKKKMLLLFSLAGILLLAGCGLPTYNLFDPGTPSEGLSAFLDAVIAGDDQTADELLYNYSWHASDPSSATVVSETDAAIVNCIVSGRSYAIVSESDFTKDSRTARVTVSFTGFDMRKFEQRLTEDAVKTVKQRQYKGETFDGPDDTVDIIEAAKDKLLQAPEEFYSTQDFTLEMVCDKGHWRVIMSDEFYSALSGIFN